MRNLVHLQVSRPPLGPMTGRPSCPPDLHETVALAYSVAGVVRALVASTIWLVSRAEPYS